MSKVSSRITNMVFDGRLLANKKEEELKEKISKLVVVPKLVAFQVGHDPASDIYLRLKSKAAERVGVDFELKHFTENSKQEEIIKAICQANENQKVWGILVQLPLPQQFDSLTILQFIDSHKDVDCLTPENLGLLMMGEPRFLPATVRGIIEIIENCKLIPIKSGLKIENSNVVIVGGSNIVGKPLAMILSNMGATVTLCRSKTENLSEFTMKADILVSATRVEGLIKGEMVKKGAVVIDVGSPKGDVDFEEVKNIASFITPVPGGVGPMTVVSLLENVLDSNDYGITEVSS